MISFHKYYVTDGKTKARVHYSDNVAAASMKRCITLYEKDYENNLPKVLEDVRNDTDIMTDYFESNRYTVVEGTPEYETLYGKLKEWCFAR